MDNIILKGKIQEFKKFHGLQNETEAEVFEKFVNYALLNAEYYDSFEFDKVSTGTAQGIDGLAISINDFIVSDVEEVDSLCKGKITVRFVLVQAKTSDNFDSGQFSNFINEAIQFFKKDNKNNVSRELHKYYDMKEHIMTYTHKMDDILPEIVLRYVYAGKKTANIEEQKNRAVTWFLDQKEKYLYSEFDCKIFGGDDVLAAYKQARNDIKKTLTFEKRISLPRMSGAKSAYLGILKCSDFINLIINEDKKINKLLFIDNVRDFLGLNSVINKNIDNTMKDDGEKDKFAILNNGVTIVAKKITPSGSDELTLESFQIVNGCQTSHIVFNNKQLINDSMYITLKIIETDDIDLSNRIIETTNSQSEVKKEALISIHSYHKKIEEYFTVMRENSKYSYFYERRPHQFDDYPDNIKNKNQIVSVSQLIKSFVSVILSEPDKVHYYYGRLVQDYMKADTLNSKLFNEKDNPGMYFIAHHIFSLCNKKTINRDYKKWLFHIAYLIKEKLFPQGFNTQKMQKDDEIQKVLHHIDDNFDEAYNDILDVIKKSNLLNNESAIRQSSTKEMLLDIMKNGKSSLSKMQDGDYIFIVHKIDDKDITLTYGKVIKCTIPKNGDLNLKKIGDKVPINIKEGKPSYNKQA